MLYSSSSYMGTNITNTTYNNDNESVDKPLKKSMLRTTFIIDESGKIIKIISKKDINTKEHAKQILNLEL